MTTKCKFKYNDNSYCGLLGVPKEFSDEIFWQNKPVNGYHRMIAYRKVIKRENYCYYHSKVMSGLIEATISASNKFDNIRILRAREEVEKYWRRRIR